MTSHLTDTIHSHLNHKVDDWGLTFPLHSSSKRPKITFIDQWLNAFAIYFAVIVSVYPSRAADLIASKHGSFEMGHKSSPGWLSMFMMWSYKGVLPFGVRSTLFLFDEFFFWRLNNLNIPNVIHILDESLFATSPPQSTCITAVCQILYLFTDLNIPIAPGKTMPWIYGYPTRFQKNESLSPGG